MDQSSILQWNCRGYYANFSNIKELHDKYIPAVMALQELIMGQRGTLSLRGYHSLQSIGRGGAGLLIRNDVPFREITLRTTLQAVGATVNIGKQYTVCSLYLPPSPQIPYVEIYELIEQLPPPVLLLGDLNARDPAWGDNTTNPRASQIKKLLEDFDMGVLNTGEHTHYQVQTDSFSCIDLSLSSTQVYTDFNWRVLSPSPEEQYDSDHFPIILKKVNANTFHPQPDKFNLKRANWSEFQSRTLISHQNEQVSVNDRNHSLTSVIINAAKHSIPLTMRPKKSCIAPYWDEACEHARSEKRRLHRRLLRNRSQRNRIEYNRARAKERLCINEARRKTWRDFVSTVNESTPCAKVWKRVKKISGKNKAHPIPVVRDNSGIVQTDPEIVTEIIGDKLAEYSSGRNCTERFKRRRERLEREELAFAVRKRSIILLSHWTN